MEVNAVQCPECKDIIFSRACHDFHYCSCGYVFIDGGFDYCRFGAKDLDKVKSMKIDVKATAKDLYDDWAKSKDKFGIIKSKENE